MKKIALILLLLALLNTGAALLADRNFDWPGILASFYLLPGLIFGLFLGANIHSGPTWLEALAEFLVQAAFVMLYFWPQRAGSNMSRP